MSALPTHVTIIARYLDFQPAICAQGRGGDELVEEELHEYLSRP
jgi:hypothetical protein